MRIIAFGYKKKSGKSTAVKFLETHIRATYPKLKVTSVSFASKLKDISFQLYGWTGVKRAVYYETHYDEKEVVLPAIDMSPRDIWIKVGNALRTIYPATWIDYALNGISSDIILISDMGFVNEAKAIRAKGGTLVKLVRDGLPQGTDPREVELDSWEDWDRVIDNNSSLDELYQKIICLWEKCDEDS